MRTHRSLRKFVSSLCVALILITGTAAPAVADIPDAMDDSWHETDKLFDPANDEAGAFGRAIATSGDVLVVGAPYDDTLGIDVGVVYVYDTSSGPPSLVTTLGPDTPMDHEHFGQAVDTDGSRIIVGSPGWSSSQGRVTVFSYDGTSGSVEATLTPSTPQLNSNFGFSVAIDGDVAGIGQPYWDYSGAYRDNGRFSFWGFKAGSWHQRYNSYYGASGTNPWYYDLQGYSIDIDNGVAVVGMPRYRSLPNQSGGVWCFTVSPSGASPRNIYRDPTNNNSGYYGSSVSGRDGLWAVGAPHGISYSRGFVQVLHYSSGSLRNLSGVLSHGIPYAREGASVAVLDGGVIAAAMLSYDRNKGAVTGFFPDATGRYQPLGIGLAADREAGLGAAPTLGASIAMSSAGIWAGAPGEDAILKDSGALYHFGLNIVAEDSSLTVPAPGVLGNDLDPDGDAMTASLQTTPTIGDVTLDADGGFTYTPWPDMNGVDTFTYVAEDATGTSPPADVQVIVTPVNDMPSFVAGADQTVPEDAGYVTVPGWATSIHAGAPNESGQSLTFTLSNDNNALFGLQPRMTASGELQFRPQADLHGSADVGVYLTDDATAGGAALSSAVQTFTITVTPINDPPTIVVPGSYTVLEDCGSVSTGFATGITAGPSNEASQALGAATINDNSALFAVQPSVSATGMLTFEPALNAFGSAEVTVTITDDASAGTPGALSTARSFTLNVQSVNDTPVAGDDMFTAREDESVVVPTGGLLVNDADVENDPLTTELASDVTTGSLFFFENGSFIYVPPAEWSGVETFTYRAFDGDKYSAPATVMLTVDSVNDEPVIEQGSLVTTVGAEDIAVLTPLSATDADADPLLWSTVMDPAHGSVSHAATGSSVVATYEPEENWSGNDTFMIAVQDPSGTSDVVVVRVHVDPVNDPPSFSAGGDVAVDEDSGAYTEASWASSITAGPANESGQVLTFDVASDNDALFAVAPSVSATGTLSFTPADDAWGSAECTVTLTDDGTAGAPGALSDVATLTIAVNPINDPPSFSAGGDVAVDEDSGAYTEASWASSITAGPANESGQVLTFDVASDNDALFAVAPSVSVTGTLSFTPADDAWGSAECTVTLTDDNTAGAPGALSHEIALTITVNPINDVPVVTPDAYATEEDAPIAIEAPGVLDNDLDVDGDTLIPSVHADVTNGVLSLDADGAFLYTPAAGWSGTDLFTYSVSDGTTESAVTTVTLDVGAVDTTEELLAGQDRIVTALEIARAAYPKGCDTVIIATAQGWPDALAGLALAGAYEAPIVLTNPSALDWRVASAVEEFGARDAIILGGEAAVSSSVESSLVARLGEDAVTRIGGATRYQTAELVADAVIAKLGDSWEGTAFVANGLSFADALAAGPISAAQGYPLFLTSGGAGYSPLSAMQERGVSSIYVLGGEAVVSQASFTELDEAFDSVERVSGANRYATAVAVARMGVTNAGMRWDELGIATGQRFPDALTAGVLLGQRDSVLLLTPSNTLSAHTRDLVAEERLAIHSVAFFGGDGAISESVRNEIMSLLR